MKSPRPSSIGGRWSEGDWSGWEWEFRETLEYIDDPESDIHETLRRTMEEYGHAQDSYIAYLETGYWRKIRNKAIANAGGKCKCGQTENLQVHHKSYCRRYTEHLNMGLLEVLCASCHAQSHGESHFN